MADPAAEATEGVPKTRGAEGAGDREVAATDAALDGEMPAAVGAPASGGEAAGTINARRADPATPARRAHGGGNWRSLVISMLVVLGVVVAWLSLMPRPARIERPTVDVVASADYALRDQGIRVLLPTVASPWRPTSVRLTDVGGVHGWHVGYTIAAEESGYLAVEEAPQTNPSVDDAWIRAQVKTARSTGTLQAGQRQWRTYSDGGDPERTSLVSAQDGLLVVVTGLATRAELEAVAGSLHPYTPVTPSATPTPTS